MRYLMILAFVVPSACDQMRGAGRASAPLPEPVPVSDQELLPDPDLSGQQDLSAIVSDDSGLRPAGTGLLGPARTVAGLGDPTRPGLWLETPLVQAKGPGRVRLVSGGASVQVTLLPAPGVATAGSRLSLAAMRELGAPLSDLVELEVSPG